MSSVRRGKGTSVHKQKKPSVSGALGVLPGIRTQRKRGSADTRQDQEKGRAATGKAHHQVSAKKRGRPAGQRKTGAIANASAGTSSGAHKVKLGHLLTGELGKLQQEAAADAAPVITEPAPDTDQGAADIPAPPDVDVQAAADEMRAMLNIGASFADDKYPGIADIWPDDLRQKVSERAARVLSKYGLTVPAWLERWEDEISLAILLAVPVRETLRLIKGNAKAEPEKPRQVDQAPPPRAEMSGNGRTIPEPPPVIAKQQGQPLQANA